VRGIGIAVEGRVAGVDSDGALRLARPGGGVARIVAGEVTLRGGERRRPPC